MPQFAPPIQLPQNKGRLSRGHLLGTFTPVRGDVPATKSSVQIYKRGVSFHHVAEPDGRQSSHLRRDPEMIFARLGPLAEPGTIASSRGNLNKSVMSPSDKIRRFLTEKSGELTTKL
jgi:hypothetical protein